MPCRTAYAFGRAAKKKKKRLELLQTLQFPF